MRATDLLLGKPRGSSDAALDFARRVGVERSEEVGRYLLTVFTVAPAIGLDPAVVVAQSALETDSWRDRWWRERLNPAGIGITGDAAQNEASWTWASGEEAALAQMVHLWLYVRGWPLPEALAPFVDLDPRSSLIPRSNLGTCRTLADLGLKWAMVADYGDRIARRGAEIFPDLPPSEASVNGSPGEEPFVTFVKHQWPGLPNPVVLPDTIRATVKIIPKGTPGWTRWAVVPPQVSYTQHFTGNLKSSAAGEWSWAAEGGRAEIDSPGSYHAIVDGTEVIIALPFNEAAGHAANNTGNVTSYACEMAIGGGYEAAFQNAAWVAAGVAVSRGWQVDTTLLQHWNWLRPDGTRKNCPSIIRDRGDWSRFVATVTRNAAAIRLFLGDPQQRVYPKPVLIAPLDAVSRSEEIAPAFVKDPSSGVTFFWSGDRYRVERQTSRRRFATLDSEPVGPDLKAGEELDGDWVFQTKEGGLWLMTPAGSRIDLTALRRVSDTKGGA